MGKSLFNFKLKSIFVLLFLISSTNFSYVYGNSMIPKSLEKLHNSLLDIGLNKISKNDKDIMNAIIKDTYAVKKMSNIVLGKYWVEASDIEKNEFSKKFVEFISSNYLKRFTNANKLEINYGQTEEISKKYIMVFTQFNFTNNDSLKINYLLIRDEKNWKIFDVLLDGSISEIATKKSEFSKILEKGGINSLIKMLSDQSK